jgi:hypothetical protein
MSLFGWFCCIPSCNRKIVAIRITFSWVLWSWDNYQTWGWSGVFWVFR